MPKIRVLIVDDSSVVRRFLSDAIAASPALEVVGTASHGALAVQKVALLNPQVVTMDVDMPEMSGLQALAAIRRTNPRLPIIMVSALTERGAAVTLEALSLGATDYVTKPSTLSGTGASQKEEFVKDLLVKIIALGGSRLAPRPPPDGALSARRAVRPSPPTAGRIDVVAIGVSTGGPNALAELIPALPADLPVPILVVQHMPPLFTRLLAERLDGKARLQVKEGAAGDLLAPGMAFIAPGNHHMVVERSGSGYTLGLNQDLPENSCRPAVDVLFRSVSGCFGPAVLAVVMTGMGQDGLRGATVIRDQGGRVLVQDEKTSVVWGMPGYVAEAGLADQILPLEQLASAIVRCARQGRPAGQSPKADGLTP
jgi:two-component system, chemotaxis family, protein-glutamate methylesterase/glutaminase